eukprot:scaffold11587_cov49-Cyclotella_meneghiniana.AAC.3
MADEPSSSRIKQSSRILLTIIAAATASSVESSSISTPQHLRGGDDTASITPSHQHRQRTLQEAANPDNRYCGSNWQTAHDSCNAPCPSALDEDCGPGLYCFGYVDCTPPPDESPVSQEEESTSSNEGPAMPPSEFVPTATGSHNSQPAPSPIEPPSYAAPNDIPSYIASLPLKPSDPITPAPFSIPIHPANLLPNPTSNYCGYGWESANKECYYACPSGLDSECPAGRSCHTWLKCNQASEDPALYNVCGVSWMDASTKCAKRCFNGDGDCPAGESCFGNVAECKSKLPTLTAEDVGQAEKYYTQEEIDALLIEAKKEEAEALAMEDPDNWWCGTSWTNMLETCSKRCTQDSDCVANSWEKATCFKTPGGPGNCAIPGQPAQQASAPGSKWCGYTWNDMLETCSMKCESNDDCSNGKTCWDAPGTCQYIGVPVKEVSDPATLWCGTSFDDAAISCHKPCPSENDDDCPSGMSCFAGSSCVEEGVPVIRENYRCGTSWDDAAGKCGTECQKDDDCTGDNEICYADVECVSEGTAGSSGMMCVSNWEKAQEECGDTNTCASDDDCEGQLLCMWVECRAGEEADAEEEADNAETTELPGCNAEVQQCPNGLFVARAPELNCEFYPCPETQTEEEAEGLSDGDEDDTSSQETMTANSQGLNDGNSQEGEVEATNESASFEWGTIPLMFASPKCEGECTMCQGDCNSDADCVDDLKCFSRGKGEVTAVPGCVGGGEGDLPGMDYCYMPEPPTTTTTTTTTEATTTTTTMESIEIANADAPELVFARECSAEDPCDACEGDCDDDSDCANGLLCFSRIQGSVEFVPGCQGVGIPGMDFCYNPNGDIILPPTDATTTTTATSTPQEELAGCSAEVKVCPGTTIVVYQNPAKDCAFDLCPGESASTASSESPDITSTEAADVVSSTEGTTSPDTTTTSIIETTVDSVPVTCDTLCLTELPPAFCPEGMADLPNCLSIEIGEICEARGECATDDSLNNCQTFDVYVRVECGLETPTQGYLMNNPAITESPVTTVTTITTENADTVDANETNAMIEDESMTLNSASIIENMTIAEALSENATSNALEDESVVQNSTGMPENLTSTAILPENTTAVAVIPLENTTEETLLELNFARECTLEDPCNACEGDCDLDSHCAAGLVCYRRMRGSVELVPGCTGVGIPGMDFCYDPLAEDASAVVSNATLETIDSSPNNATGSSSNLTLQMGEDNVASAAAASFTYDRNPDANDASANEGSPSGFNYDPSYWESTDTYGSNSENYHEGWDLTGYYTPQDSDSAYMNNSIGWVVLLLGALAALFAVI